MFSGWMWVILAICATFSFFKALVSKNKHKILPPGPRGLPIIGHLHLLGKHLHRDLANLSKKYGPIMHLRLGFVTNIVVSSPHAAELFLKTYDLNFASRPPHEAAKYISYGQRNLSFGKYGPYWRDMRKFCTLHLLSNNKNNSFQSMRKEEVGLLVKSLKQASKNHAVVNLSAALSSLIGNMSCLMVLGKKYPEEELDKRGFKYVIKESMELTAVPNLGDYYPFLGVLDFQGLTRRMKAVSKIYDNFLEKAINEHEKLVGTKDQGNDFISTMLALMRSGDIGFDFDRRHMKGVMLDMVTGAADTAAAVVEWLFSELLKQPQLMKKVQKELEETIGLDRMVEEADFDNLKYLDMVIKETLRLHPVGPLLLPHESIKDCTVDGYHIPKKSRVIVNVWAIGRDPNAWSDPEKFIPERFVGRNIDVWGQNFELLPFGSGRRGCPGMHLGHTMVRVAAAQLLHCFNWELPNNMLPEDLDMAEEFGLVLCRTNHLKAIPTYRLRV